MAAPPQAICGQSSDRASVWCLVILHIKQCTVKTACNSAHRFTHSSQVSFWWIFFRWVFVSEDAVAAVRWHENTIVFPLVRFSAVFVPDDPHRVLGVDFFFGCFQPIVLILTIKAPKTATNTPFMPRKDPRLNGCKKPGSADPALQPRYWPRLKPGQSKQTQPGLFFWVFTLRIYPAITQDLSSVQKGYGSEFKPGLSCVQNPGSHLGFWYKRGINVTVVVNADY